MSIMNRWILALALFASACGGAQSSTTSSTNGVEGVSVRAHIAAEAAQQERYAINVGDERSFGAERPSIRMVVFTDYQCPYCSRAEATVQQLLERHPNDLRVYVRNHPLGFHPMARPSANLAMEAFTQRGEAGFRAMHALLFEHQTELSRETLLRLGGELGLSDEAVRNAIDNGTHDAAIDNDLEISARFGVGGTPAFFINGIALSGARPIDQFEEIISNELQYAARLERVGEPRSALPDLVMASARDHAEREPQRPRRGGQRPRVLDESVVYNVPVGDSPTLGSADALVTIVVFSDYQCPFCARAEDTLTQVRQRYGNDVRIVWRDNPLPFHEYAMNAALIARAAHQRGNFWRMHDELFAHRQELDDEHLRQYARSLGIDDAAFTAALQSEAERRHIEKDQELAESLGARGTPSFFINGRHLRGAQPFENFVAFIDEELVKARGMVDNGTPRARLYESIIAGGASELVYLPAPEEEGGDEPSPNVPSVETYDVPIPPDAPSIGPRNAHVTMQIFSDFQCPFCARFAPTLRQLEQEFEGRVRLVFRQYPLPFHDNAHQAAEASIEARAQGGDAAFWRYHDALFGNNRDLSRAALIARAREAGLDAARMQRALERGTHRARVDADINAVSNARLAIGTPSVLINGHLMQGALPIEDFRNAINSALAEPTAAQQPNAAPARPRRRGRHR